jgi:cytidylate kinase
MLASGLIYRAMAWYLLQGGWQPGQPADMVRLSGLRLSIGADGGIHHQGRRLDEALKDERVAAATSRISTAPAVREQANRLLKATVEAIAAEGKIPGVILEGRDMGSVVFPHARHKFFLDGDPAVRAERRFLELARQSPGVQRGHVAQGLAERDARDAGRDIAPLKPAADATIIDTTHLTLEQVLDAICAQLAG